MRLDPRLLGLHALGQASRVPHALAFARAARDPVRAQRERLREILALNAATEYSRRHGLGAARDHAELRRRAPLVTYAELVPSIERMGRGEPDVLCAGKPEFYALSTGTTTGTRKLSPVVPAFRREFQRTVHVSLAHVALRFPSAFTGKLLYFVGARAMDRTPDGTEVGYTSGYNFTTLPAPVRRLYAWPYELFTVKDPDARAYLALWLAASQRITFCAAIFPSALLATLRVLDDVAEPLARDLERGSLRDDLALTPQERAFFVARAVRDARLADLVRALAREHRGKLPATRLWPSLRLVYCWIGAAASAYLPELRARLGPDVAVRDAIYAANEGWCNVTFGEDRLGGPVALSTHFYEFVPEDALERADAGERALDVGGLELGRRYHVAVTTSAGFVRYLLGDVVECCGFHGAAPDIRFVRRSGASLSLAGEKLDEDHVRGAVTTLASRLGVDLAGFVARPRPGAPAAWSVVVEPREGWSDAAAERFRAALDDELGRANVDYASYRCSRALGPVVLELAARGAFEAHRRRSIAQGGAEAQLKTVHLCASDEAWARLGLTVERVLQAPGPSRPGPDGAS